MLRRTFASRLEIAEDIGRLIDRLANDDFDNEAELDLPSAALMQTSRWGVLSPFAQKGLELLATHLCKTEKHRTPRKDRS